MSEQCSKIFICYRRVDSQAWAGRIYDRLAGAFTPESVYMDVDNIDPGLDFFEVIEETLKTCSIFFAIIGRQWLVAEEAYGRRLDNPDDLVRHEIAVALNRNIRVIPILVDSANMPKSDELPEDIATLVRRNAVEIHHDKFNPEVASLIEKIRSMRKEIEEQRQREEAQRKAAAEEKRRREEARRKAAAEEKRRQAEALKLLAQERRREEAQHKVAAEGIDTVERLEQTEKRLALSEKKNRVLNEKIREHESDVSAWNMELKLRTARINQLEKMLEEQKKEGTNPRWVKPKGRAP